jgi:hypothetical protein
MGNNEHEIFKENTTDRNRTGTPRRTPDFKSGASTNSATVASLKFSKKRQKTMFSNYCERRLRARFDFVNSSFKILFVVFANP